MPNLQDTDVHSRPTVEAGLCDLLPDAQRQHRNTLATGTKGGAAWVNRRTGRYLVPMVWLPMKAPITQPRRYYWVFR